MPCRIYKFDYQEKNLNLDRDLNHVSPDLEPGALNHKYLSMGWYENFNSSMVKSARLEIRRSAVQITVQLQIFLLKI